MSQLAPPPSPPRMHLGDDGSVQRYRMRMTQIVTTLITLLTTAWLCTLGWLPAILALMVAKHILVAVLAMGIGIDARDGGRGMRIGRK